jgi:hypothetical protein
VDECRVGHAPVDVQQARCLTHDRLLRICQRERQREDKRWPPGDLEGKEHPAR